MLSLMSFDNPFSHAPRAVHAGISLHFSHQSQCGIPDGFFLLGTPTRRIGGILLDDLLPPTTPLFSHAIPVRAHPLPSTPPASRSVGKEGGGSSMSLKLYPRPPVVEGMERRVGWWRGLRGTSVLVTRGGCFKHMSCKKSKGFSLHLLRLLQSLALLDTCVSLRRTMTGTC